jgi:2-C-methyl-D-erythritol 4-phosphate cytidylyltransferase/2-C-methyl-D-erythritol 2,4-cyclodiphosphate synthase
MTTTDDGAQAPVETAMLGLIVICSDEGAGLAASALLDPLLGAPLLARGIAAGLPADSGVTGVVVVPPDLVDRVKADVVDRFGLDEIDRVVAGGPDRRAALLAGIEALPADVDVVIVQEGARALAPAGLVDRVVAAAQAADAAVPAVATIDAVVLDDGGALALLDVRPRLRVLQGPAVWKVASLRAALSGGGDELEAAARAGSRVAIVAGDDDNRLLRDAADVSRALEVFARRAADYVFVYPSDLLPDDPLQKALDPTEARIVDT